MNEAQQNIVSQALAILSNELAKPEFVLTNPETASDFLKLKLAQQEREVFAVLYLNSQHGVIEYEELFFGTIDGATVHPREVVKPALAKNAAAIIFAHNHPSGVVRPSQSDERITQRLKSAMELVDIRVLDHIIIGGMDHYSFAENGLL